MPDDQGNFRNGDPEPSREAARRINATRLENMVLRIIRIYGPPIGLPLCVAQIWKNYLPDLSVDTISPRMKQLELKGLIECLGKQPRPNRYGRTHNQLVYQCTDKGRGYNVIHHIRPGTLGKPEDSTPMVSKPFASFARD